MIATAAFAIGIAAGAVLVALEVHWHRHDKAVAADRHALGHVTNGQTVSAHCACGQTFSGMTEASARMSWLKHRRQETT